MNTLTTMIPHELPYELAALAKAKNYQTWLSELVAPFLGARILELGAGIGNMSQHLPERELLILTDVEDHFIEALQRKFPSTQNSATEVLAAKTDAALDEILFSRNLDTIVSFNVLEHVDDHEGLFRRCLDALEKSQAPGPKRIVTLVPAHSWAYGSVDKALGHFRRYSRDSFATLVEQADSRQLVSSVHYRYVNIPGLFAWFLVNRILRLEKLGSGLVGAFETLYPVIRFTDDILHDRLHLPLGQSLLAVVTLK